MKTFFLIIFGFILIVSCNKKAPEAKKAEYTAGRFSGSWNATKNSSATGTSTYTANFSPNYLSNNEMHIWPFSGIVTSGVVSLDHVHVSGNRFSFSNQQITNGFGYATGTGHLIDPNTMSMTYTIAHTSPTNTSQEYCTETLTK